MTTHRPPPLLFGGVLEEGAYPLARRLLRGRMIEEIVRSRAPNKVLMANPLPSNPAEQMLLWSYRSALSQVRCGNCSRLQSYRHSVGCADDPTCPDCHPTPSLYLISFEFFLLFYIQIYHLYICFSPIFFSSTST